MSTPPIKPAAPVFQAQQIRQSVPLRPTTPQCEAKRIYSYHNDPKGKPLPQCEHSSSYVINGEHLCKRHAGDAALRILLEQSGSGLAGPDLGRVQEIARRLVEECSTANPSWSHQAIVEVGVLMRLVGFAPPAQEAREQ